MRKRYTAEELDLIKREAENGTSCEKISEMLGVSKSSIHNTIHREGIKFCRRPITPIEGEIWKEVPEIPDLMVSDKGRFVRPSTNSLLAGFTTTGGYTTVDVSGHGRFSAHRMIANAFIPNPDNKPEVNHKDGVKSHNAASNLEWVTPSENQRHAIETGLKTVVRGQDHPRTAMTDAEIRQAAAMHEEGKTFKEIAETFGTHRKTVSGHVRNYRESV